MEHENRTQSIIKYICLHGYKQVAEYIRMEGSILHPLVLFLTLSLLLRKTSDKSKLRAIYRTLLGAMTVMETKEGPSNSRRTQETSMDVMIECNAVTRWDPGRENVSEKLVKCT
jgi:hypothetical protein